MNQDGTIDREILTLSAVNPWLDFCIAALIRERKTLRQSQSLVFGERQVFSDG